MSIFLLMCAIVVAFSVGRFLIFVVGRRLKGEVLVHLGPEPARAGHPIRGTLQVNSKRRLGPGRLVASVVCYEEWTEYRTSSRGGSGRRTKRRDIYREDIGITDGLVVSPGQPSVWPFAIQTPQPQDTIRNTPPPGASGFTKALHSLSESLGEPDRDIHWKIEGRFDIEGLDLIGIYQLPFDYRPT